MRFHPTNKYILAVGGNSGNTRRLSDKTVLSTSIYLLNIETGTRQIVMEDLFDWGLDLSSDGRLLAAGGRDGKLHFWDMATSREVSDITTGAIRVLAFSRDSHLIAVGCVNGSVQIWGVTTRKLVSEFQPHAKDINDITFSPNNKYLFAAGMYSRYISVWNVSTGERVTHLEGHVGSVNALHFNRSGTLLASGGSDGTLHVWGAQDN